ncbi:MAG: benzoate/H(+) symporter BenE family transporter [Neisseria sp.]|nr:benzoate/H(+) symporter BenE family transporter [Neisseria sp.]
MMKLPFASSHLSAAVAALLVSYGSSAVIIFQAAKAFGATDTQVVSWFTVIGLVCAVLTVVLSLRYRAPVMMAWCTPGAAMMVSLTGIPLSDAVAAFMFAGGMMFFASASGFFDRLVGLIPPTLASAMLAGILVNFGSRVFAAMNVQTALVLLMLAVYLLVKIRWQGYSILWMLCVALVYGTFAGLLDWSAVRLMPPVLEWVSPTFHFGHIVSVGVPLFIASLAAQNVPGMAIFRAYGFDKVPAAPLVGSSAAATFLFAPFGAFMVNLAAISSAICMGSDVDKDPSRRYLSTVLLGALYVLLGAAGGVVVSLFAVLPEELLFALAGIAVFATLQNNLINAMRDEDTREASLITMLASASGLSLFGISSAFWGLVFGLAVYHLNRWTARQKKS